MHHKTSNNQIATCTISILSITQINIFGRSNVCYGSILQCLESFSQYHVSNPSIGVLYLRPAALFVCQIWAQRKPTIGKSDSSRQTVVRVSLCSDNLLSNHDTRCLTCASCSPYPLISRQQTNSVSLLQ